MAQILWLSWCGGGNLPPSLGIARTLTERGHAMSFAGRPEMIERVRAAGFRTIELSQAYAQVERYPAGSPLTRAGCYLTSPAVGAQIREVVASEAPDIVLVDGMFPVAHAEAALFECPTAAICHTFLFRQLDIWRAQIARLNGMRVSAGFSELPGLDELWKARNRVIVTTLGGLDVPVAPGWELVRHTGPVLENEVRAKPADLPWPQHDSTPLVLVSFSTGFEQRSPVKLQRTLDALARLPVHVVATTGGIIDPSELQAPENAVVLTFADHDQMLRRAALVVTHGGHGTAMRSLLYGVPMILMPGFAHDQPTVAATVQELGAGRALPGDADVEAIFEAAETVLNDSLYRDNAKRLSAVLANVDGAAVAANAIEDLVAL